MKKSKQKIGLALALILMSCSALNAQEALKFTNMLLPKSNVDYLISSAAGLSKLVFVQQNSSTKDPKRLVYDLVVYAYNSKNVLLSGYNPLKLTSSTVDSSYYKDIFISSYTMTKTALTALIPSNTYNYLRFKPYNDVTSEDLKNYISYSVYAVGSDGITGVKKSTSTSAVTTLQLNPSPPR